jgi:hypothetical protein
MNYTVHIGVLATLAMIVLAMAAYRYALVRHEDPTLDILESNTVAAEQSKVFRRANAVELWGKILTAVLIVYGLALGGAYVTHLWRLGEQIPH